MKKSFTSKINIYYIISLFSVIFFLFVDLFSKYYFTDKNYFSNLLISIKYSENFGSVFGIFSNFFTYNLIIIILSIVVICFLLYKYKYFFENNYLILSFIFIISGILGNLYDRIIFGFVRDFISLEYLFIFNLADFYLTLGFLFYLIYEVKNK